MRYIYVLKDKIRKHTTYYFKSDNIILNNINNLSYRLIFNDSIIYTSPNNLTTIAVLIQFLIDHFEMYEQFTILKYSKLIQNKNNNNSSQGVVHNNLNLNVYNKSIHCDYKVTELYGLFSTYNLLFYTCV